MQPIGTAQTDDERAVEAVLAGMPGIGGVPVSYEPGVDAVMSPTHRAVDSRSWAVDAGTARYWLKVLHPDLRPFVDVAAAADAAGKAAALGVTPALRHAAPAEGAVVFDRLGPDWRAARMDDLRSEAVLSPLLDVQKRVQAGPRFARDWTVFDGLRQVAGMLGAEGIVPSADTWWLRDAVGDVERAIDASGWDARPCHADALASNVMIGPGGALQLVDFDRACNTDPFYDLAVFLNEAFVFDAEMKPALEAYEGRFRDASLARCRLYAVADDLLWGSWATLMNATSPRRGLEFLKYAQWRLLRCRMAVRDTRFEEMLRGL